MAYVVAIIAPGEMGSAVAARLSERGVRVTTSLAGRSPASAARAQGAHMAPVPEDHALVEGADFFLSICPPGQAIGLAERLKPALTQARKKPIYVDCNAVSPDTAIAIGSVLESTGCQYVDGGIIGPPPPPNGTGTRIYVSGAAAREVARLSDFGVQFPALDGPIGAASALKMSYAGITKGFTALGSVMALAAAQGGVAEELYRELADSQPALLNWLSRQVPRMYSKAYRWVAEMDEIADYIGDQEAGSRILEGAARFYRRIAADMDGGRHETGRLTAFFETSNRGERARADNA